MSALKWTVPALVGTVAAGGLGTDVRSRWYVRLDKPAWQPLNVGWTWIFFTAKKPRWALAEILALEGSNLDLIRRSAKVDPASGWLLAPYAAWTGFATALNAAIVVRNPRD